MESLPDAGSGSLVFDVTLLEPELLQEGNALKSTIRALESLVLHPSCNTERLLVDLMAQPNRFEFVFAMLSDQSSSTLRDYVLHHFPTTAKQFHCSLSSALLLRLSTYFFRLPVSISGFEADHKAVEQALPTLNELVTRFLEAAPASRGYLIDHERSRRVSFLDPALLRNLRCNVPTNREEAQHIADEILQGQRYILERFLRVLRDKQLRSAFKSAYIQLEHPAIVVPPNEILEAVAEVSSTPIGGEDGASSTRSLIEDLQADLHNEAIRAFGIWRVFVSSRAENDLRVTSRRDFQRFKIIMRKIRRVYHNRVTGDADCNLVSNHRELSSGHFSAENHIMLMGVENGIPVYEAKLVGNSRLVYYIHCAKDLENERETQVLRIFGLYSHNQIQKHLWNIVSRELGGWGVLYRERCLPQVSSHYRTDGITLPRSFPHDQSADEDLDREPVIAQSNPYDEDEMMTAELDSIMSKFFELSKGMLKSILVDEGGSYLFDLEPRQQEIVNHRSSCYVLGGAGTGKTITMMFKMCGRQRKWEAQQGTADEIKTRPRQMFVTQSRYLVEKVQEDYIKLFESFAMAKRKSADQPVPGRFSKDDELFDLDEEEYWSDELPKQFSALEDKHFPLFITYDHLCRLLEEDFIKDDSFVGRVGIRGNILDETADLSSDYMERRKEAFVSYDIFLSCYWAHFPENLRKRIDPALLFAEFLGVIKGSEEALRSSSGVLTSDEYFALSGRKGATFATQRETVYQLYEKYQTIKAQRRDWDAADRTRTILGALKKGVPGGKLLDFVYIDEAQDNLIIDAPVIRSLSSNSKGFFWAGDTAQTISAGSSFRFNDLKSFLYRIEMESKAHSSHREEPQLFHLALNHRSHRGIVNCAHSVVEIIAKYWPYTIDTLGKERGVMDGPKPLFFSRNGSMFDHFFRGESARQCTIVRNEAARDLLRTKLGAKGTILTLYESKGLEYDDVLLYNFFEDSLADASQWRVVLNILGSEVACPRVDDTRHNTICRELKSLYVAITRARQHLWIFDCSEKADPMQHIWDSRSQIDHYLPGSPIPRLVTTSSADAWGEEGRKLFRKKQYSQAAECFERAGLDRQKDMAMAYDFRQRAQQHPLDRRSLDLRSGMFLEAAQAFHRLACSTSNKEYFRLAAECFAHSGDYASAAKSYEHSSKYELSARFYRRAEEFDDLVRILDAYGRFMDTAVCDELYTVAKIYYLKTNQRTKAKLLFRSLEKAAEFMGEYGFTGAQAQVLAELGSITEAAEVHQEEGRVLDAIRLFSSAPKDAESMKNAHRFLLDGFWKYAPLGTSSKAMQEMPEIRDILCEATRMSAPDMEEEINDEITMFRYLHSDRLEELLELSDKFLMYHNNPTYALRCLDHAFSSSSLFHDMTFETLPRTLKYFKTYTELLRDCLSSTDLCDDDKAMIKLYAFGVRRLSPEEFLVFGNSMLLQDKERIQSIHTLRTMEDGLVLSLWEAQALIQDVIRKRMHSRIIMENDSSAQSQAMLHGSSIKVSRMTSQDYNYLVRSHLQQILICDAIRPFGAIPGRQQADQRRFWLQRLYHALMLGSLRPLNLVLIPEFYDACRVVRSWASFLLCTLDSHSGGYWNFMTRLMIFGTVGRSLNPTEKYHDFSRLNWVRSFQPPYLLHVSNGRSVVYDALSFMKGVRDDSLSHGAYLMKHILDTRIPMDVRLLCNILDGLCGSFILSHKLRQGVLHDVTLPLSWWTRLAGSLENLAQKESDWWHLCVDPLRALIMEIGEEISSTSYPQQHQGTRAGYLRFADKPIVTGSPDATVVLSMVLWRLCRNLCTLGEHFPQFELRENIRNTIACIGGLPDHGIEKSNTKTWGQLSNAFRNSATRMMDEVINVQNKMGGTIFPPPTGSQRILYERLEDLPSLIDSINLSGADNTPSQNPSTPFHSLNLAPGTENPPCHDTERDKSNTAGEYAQVSDNIERLNGDQDVVADVTYTLEQVTKIVRFQRGWRRLLRLRNHKQKANLFAKRARVFDMYYNASKERTWSDRSRYRLLFLGPLAHIFLCLEWLYDYSTKQKKVAKKALLMSETRDVEVVMKQIGLTTNLVRETEELRKRLEPLSNFHSQNDLGGLRKAALAVEQLVSKVPNDISNAWYEDLQLGLKGIVAMAQRKKSRPQLNSEDLDM